MSSSSSAQSGKTKLFKLWVHQKNFSKDDLVLNPKEFPNTKEGDILEIHYAGEDGTRLLLQLRSVSADFQQKDTISIEQSVANFFQLRTYWDVQVRKVEPDSVTLDLAELLVKDMYISRSEMWRLNKAIVGSCVYVTKKLFHCGVRAQVNELWRQGQKVSCGVISEDTKVIFRSSTATVYLLIQMSQEMWKFDLYGDLYFEKTVSGFLHELFSKWKELHTNHEVTIVLFSRSFYEAHSLEDFPEEMRPCIQQDPYNRFYEDFFQVVTRANRLEDWVSLLVTLKQCINQYPKHGCRDAELKPACRNSLAFEGNFLEAINLTMNLFERDYVDRNFDKTGQTTIVITPGPGVFEVDRNLTSITKQRTLDSGVAVDLVCMAEQPLHTVPLLKFYNKDPGGRKDLGDDYNIPHWMNHSFYASPKSRSTAGKFTPRIKAPEIVLNYFGKNPEGNPHTKGLHRNVREPAEATTTLQMPDFVDYDAYDARVFRSAAPKSSKKIPMRTVSSATAMTGRYGSSCEVEGCGRFGSRDEPASRKSWSSPPAHGSLGAVDGGLEARHTRAEQRPVLSSSVEQPSGPAPMFIESNATRRKRDIHESRQKERFRVGSLGALDSVLAGSSSNANQLPRRAHRTLINPFKPNVLPCRWICNRHRWAHTFPKGPHGEIVRYHYEKAEQEEKEGEEEDSSQGTSGDVEQAARVAVAARKHLISEASGMSDEQDILEEEDDFKAVGSDESSNQFSPSEPRPTVHDMPPPPPSGLASPRRRVVRPVDPALNQTSAEHDWTAAVKTNVDWKSLTTPACLPLTSEFHPDKRTLNSEYVEYNYEIYADEDMDDASDAGTSQDNAEQESIADDEADRGSRAMTAEEVFQELVSQRLAEGFQLITAKEKTAPDKRQSVAAIPFREDGTQEYFLSLGRNSHKLSLLSPQITVKGYRPRHPYHPDPVPYRYRLWMPPHDRYEPNEVHFTTEELDKYNWNYLDQYISNNRDFSQMIEALKYWRARFLLLPMTPRKTSGERETGKTDEECRVDGLLRFIEALNRIKRPNVLRTVKKASSGSAHLKPRSSNADKQGRRASRDRVSSAKSPSPDSIERRTSPVRVENSSEPASSAGDESAVPSDDDALSVQSPLESMVEAMMDSRKVDGMVFLPSMTSLEPKSFLAIEASHWLMQNVDGVNSRSDAVQLGQKLLDSKLIHHASGSIKQKFADGFFIFFIAPKSTWRRDETPDKSRSGRYRSQFALERYEMDLLEGFQINWFEVAVSSDLNKEQGQPLFLSRDLLASFPANLPLDARRPRSWRSPTRTKEDMECTCGPDYKFVNLDPDPQRKSDRRESVAVRYHGSYHPSHAFEIEVHWIVATGCIVSDLVQTWARRAPSSSFHLVPVPVSPFPDPLGDNVDPFRLPVFIPLCVGSLCEEGSDELFKEFDSSTRNLRMFLFQEAILRRFGFLRDSPHGSGHTYSYVAPPVQSRAHDYVHESGNAFARIPAWQEEDAATPYRASFSRGALEHSEADEQFRSRQPEELGFLWTDNHMLTKRWRSAATGDVETATRLKAEFEKFCRNDNGALNEFWDSFHKTSLKVTGLAETAGRGSGEECEEENEKVVTVEKEAPGGV